MKKIAIKGFSRYMPQLKVSNEDISKIVETSDDWIYSRTGIRHRHISTGENTSDLCAKTALQILEKTRVSPKDIDIIIVATCSADYNTPSTACLTQNLIGASNAFAFDINAACSGFVYGITTAEKLLRCGTYKNALVIGAETLSKLVDWNDRRTCVLFGDGAGGALLTAGEYESFLGEDIHSDGEKWASLTGGENPVINPFSQTTERKHGLEMDGRGIFDFAFKRIPKSLTNLLEREGLTFDDISYIVPHQANSRIIEAMSKKLKIDISKFYMNIDQYGNTSAATIPICLSEMADNGLITEGSGQKILLAGFGGGLTWGSVLIKV